MKSLYRIVCLFVGMLFAFSASSVQAAGLFQKAAGDKVLLAEVQSYGDYELKAEYLNTLAEKLGSELTAKNIPMAYRGVDNMTNEGGRHNTSDSAEDAAISRIHMDAIVRGHQFNYGFAAAKLIRYADDAVGRKHFYDDEAVKAWRQQAGTLYRLTPAVMDQAKMIAKRYGAKYLLFVNDKDIDVRLKHNMFGSHTDRSTRGKKMKASLDYYIVNTETGKVYEGHCDNKKTAQMLNFALVQTGKGMNVDAMLNQVMEAQADDVAQDFSKNGFPAVR